MRLNAPKKIVWLISLIIAVLAIISTFVVIPFVTVNAFWVMGVAWLLLFLATFLKGYF